MELSKNVIYVCNYCDKKMHLGAVAVTQLVEQLLLIPEVHSLNPVIGKIYIEHLFIVNCIEKTKIKKRPGMAHLKKKWHL